MTIREQLVREIEQAPDALVEELLDFYLFIKQRRESVRSDAAITPQSGLLDFLSEVQVIQAEVPTAEWDKLPHDGSINHDHYLYGASKVEP
jgi:hypothetical protein